MKRRAARSIGCEGRVAAAAPMCQSRAFTRDYR